MDHVKSNKDGYSSIMLAASRGHKKAVRALLNYCSPTDQKFKLKRKNGFMGLIMASQNGHSNIVKMLLDEKYSDIQHYYAEIALILAAANGHRHIINYIVRLKNLNHELSTNKLNNLLKGRHLIYFYVGLGGYMYFGYFYGNVDTMAIRMAICKGFDEIVLLLADHFDIDKGSILSLVVQFNNYSLAKKLIEREADINFLDYDGMTPLMHACTHGYLPIVKLLLEHNVEVDESIPGSFVKQGSVITCKKPGYTALMLACEKGYFDIIEKLLPYSNINAKSSKGMRPLACFSRCSKKTTHPEQCKKILFMLLENGAEIPGQVEKQRCVIS